jgi:heterodisulfide reductase subunit A-like polyferredoxin
MCYCTGECPGFQGLNLWQLVNRVRNEMDVEFAVVHPQLCVDDGDRFLRHFARPDHSYIVGGCDPRMQRKMFKDTLADVGIEYDKHVVSLDLRNMSTDEAINKVSQALDGLSR